MDMQTINTIDLQDSANAPNVVAAQVEQNPCAKCGIPNSNSKCSRCSIPYCSRDCQVGHWPEHKLKCRQSPLTDAQIREKALADRQRLIDQLFNRVCKLIAGNVLILSAWYKRERGFIEIEITEGLVDFSESGTHFLHMTYINMDADQYDKYSEPDKCFVKFKLNDYEYESTIAVKIPAATIRAKQPQPSQEWTLMYEV
jgi:hypothetical protein